MAVEQYAMAFHPAADAFPMMDDKRFAELVEDIRLRGQLEPITVHNGMILDGRNRYRACLKLGIEPKVRQAAASNPYDFTWSMNGSRRDLVGEQRALIWKFCNEKSEEWRREQQRIQEEANRKRSEAAEEGRVGRAAAKAKQEGTLVVGQLDPPLNEPKVHATREAKAEAAHVGPSTMKRADELASARPDLAEKVRKGEMRPNEAHRQMKKEQVAEKVSALPDGTFRVFYADPPWEYNDTRAMRGDEGGIQGGAADHYPTMSFSDLCAMPVQERSQPDAVLFLWVTSPLLPRGLELAKAWGFAYKSSFVWDKVRHNMGHYNSVRHEFLLVCTRGSCTPDVSKLFDSVQEVERTERHSEKPEVFREIIDTIYPHGPRIELFRRGAAPDGWKVWGNEAAE